MSIPILYIRSSLQSGGLHVQSGNDILLDGRGQIQEVDEGTVDTHDVYTAGGILFGVCQNLTQGLGGGDIHVQIERRELFVAGVEEQGRNDPVAHLQTLSSMVSARKYLGSMPKWEA